MRFLGLIKRWKSSIAHCKTHKPAIFHKEERLELEDGKILQVSSKHNRHRGLKIAFIGTSSLPLADRSESCILVKNDESCFMFNCGENAYREVQYANYLHRGCTVFISKMDLNHVVGLPSMLSSGILKHPVTIYGPQGLRQYIRTTLRACFARVPTKYAVHELILNNSLRIQNLQSHSFLHEDELYGDDIVCSQDGICQLVNDDKVCVKAGVLCENSQSWGFVYEAKKRHEEVRVEKTSVAILNHEDKMKSFVQDVDILIQHVESITGAAAAGKHAKAKGAKCLVLTSNLKSDAIQESIEASNIEFEKKSLIHASDHMTITVC